MVISVKKESEKTLSLSKITKEILEYCDTEAALENLRDEWSKFKDFKNLLKVARYYSPRYYNIKSAGTFGLDEELSFLDKMRKMLSSDGVSKWTDLSKKDKTITIFYLTRFVITLMLLPENSLERTYHTMFFKRDLLYHIRNKMITTMNLSTTSIQKTAAQIQSTQIF